MKGLKEYIRKHGRHFTEELAYAVAGRKWTSEKVYNATEKFIYYNVTASTLGDMTYLMNQSHRKFMIGKHECIKFTLFIVGNYNYYGGEVFKDWLEDIEDFDFTPYI